MTEPCDFLTPAPRSADNSDLRQRLLTRTLGVLRRRRWLRRTGLAAALAACFAAGVLSARWLWPATRPLPELVRHEPPSPSPPERPDADRRTVENPREVELVKAADHVLVAQGDPLTALHLYTKALDDSGDDALTISTDDSFLMMAIKDARKRERTHAKKLD
jgi:hypothetical protein